MQNVSNNDDPLPASTSVPFSRASLQLRVNDLLARRCPATSTSQNAPADLKCKVNVSVDGPWCTFEGVVNSQRTRTALFLLAPQKNGKRFIVDKIRICNSRLHQEVS